MTTQPPSIAHWTETDAVVDGDSLLLHRPGPTGAVEEYRVSISGVLDPRYVLVPNGLAGGRIIGTNNAGGSAAYAPGSGIAFAGGNLVANGQDHLAFEPLTAFDPSSEIIVNAGGVPRRMPAAFLGSSGFLAPFANASAAGIVKPAIDGFIVGPGGALGLAVGAVFSFDDGRLALNVGPGLTNDGGTLAPALGASLGLVNGAIALQDLAFSGDVSGSGNSAIALTLPTITTPGTFTKITVDGKGRVTLGAALAGADVQGALGFTPLATTLVGAAGGLASLDANAKLNAAQIPDAIVGGLVPQGTWNPVTNTPSLASGVGTAGFEYLVSAAGTLDIGCTNLVGSANSIWAIGDIALFSSGAWQHVPATQIFGSMAAQNANAVAVTGGSVTGQGVLGLSNGSAWQPLLYVPDVIEVETDSAGTIYRLVDAAGTTSLIGLVTPVATITVAAASTLSAGANTELALPVTVPDAVEVWTDPAGNLLLAMDAAGNLTIVSVAGGAAVFTSVASASNTATVASATTLVTNSVTEVPSSALLPDYVHAVTDSAGNIIEGILADGTRVIAKLQAMSGGAGGAAGGIADGIDVTGQPYGAVFDGRDAYLLATFTAAQNTLQIARYSGAVTLPSGGFNLTIVPAPGCSGFEPNEIGWLVSIVATDGSGVSYTGTITAWIDYDQVKLDTPAPATVTTANVIWPAFAPSAVGKTILVEGGNTGFKRKSRGPQTLLATVAGYVSPTQVTLASNFGTDAAALPTRVAWGTDNTDAICAAGNDALAQGLNFLWFPGSNLICCAFRMAATGVADHAYFSANASPDAAFVNTIWLGGNVRGVFTDVAGRRVVKDIIPQHANGGPPPTRGVIGRRHFPRSAAASTIRLMTIGDSQGMADPSFRSTAWGEEPLVQMRIREDNPGKTIISTTRAIGGAQYGWLTSQHSVLVAGAVSAKNTPWYTNLSQPYWNFVQTMDDGQTPDLYWISVRGGNDATTLTPLKIQALINKIRALPADGGGRPPDIMMMTGMVGHGSDAYTFDTNLAHSSVLIRTMARFQNFGLLDIMPTGTTQKFGWGDDNRQLRLATGTAAAVSAGAALQANIACNDFSAHFILAAASGAAAWAAVGRASIALSPQPGNVLLLDTDPVSGVLRVEVRLWGREVPTTVTCSGSTLSVAAGASWAGTYTMQGTGTRVTASPGPGPFTGNAGNCIFLPGADTFGDDQRSYLFSVTSDTVADMDDFWGGASVGHQATFAQAGTIEIGGHMFLPIDADAALDLVIPGAGPGGGDYRGRITGYTNRHTVTVDPPISTPLAAASVTMFMGRISVPRFSTTIPAGTDAGANPLIDVSVVGHKLQVRYQAPGVRTTFDPPYAYLGFCERFGDRFYPAFAISGAGPVTVTLNNFWVDERVLHMPGASAVPSATDNFYPSGVTYTAYGGGHPSSIGAARIDVPVLNAQDFST